MIVCFFVVSSFLLKESSDAVISKSPFSFYGNSDNGNSPLSHYKASIRDVPHHVLIAFNQVYCSGALIFSKIIVTAASCFITWHEHRIVVKVGSESITGLGHVIEVLEIKRHEYFGHNNILDNDIALVILKEHVIFGHNVMKIVMIESDISLESGTSIEVSGWGYANQQPAKYANSLLWTEMLILTDNECATIYPNLKTTSNFCGRYTAERTLSDNGGPAIAKDLLVGILSYGADREAAPFVALLTNISYFYKWITLNSKRLMSKFCVDHNIKEYETFNILSIDDEGIW